LVVIQLPNVRFNPQKHSARENSSFQNFIGPEQVSDDDGRGNTSLMSVVMRNPQLNSWMKGNNKKGLLALANLLF
jgi:hypothetical protein